MKMIVFIVIGILALGFVALALRYFLTHRKTPLRPEEFHEQWLSLMKHCASRKTWPQAIVEADDLLDDALKKTGYKGKTTGERLVAAQRDLTDNENVWLGHKMRKRILDEDVRKLKKQDVLKALSGFRQALRDIGALEK